MWMYSSLSGLAFPNIKQFCLYVFSRWKLIKISWSQCPIPRTFCSYLSPVKKYFLFLEVWCELFSFPQRFDIAQCTDLWSFVLFQIFLLSTSDSLWKHNLEFSKTLFIGRPPMILKLISFLIFGFCYSHDNFLISKVVSCFSRALLNVK